jgi:small GTP-binding protein
MGNCFGCEKPSPTPNPKPTMIVDRAPKNTDPVKTVFLGSIGVGKSRTAMQLSGRIAEFNDDSTSAAGTNLLKRLDLPGYGSTLVAIWDTAGEERFFSVSKSFIREAKAIFFLYNVASKETFESLKDFWIKQALEIADQDIPCIILGNKCD